MPWFKCIVSCASCLFMHFLWGSMRSLKVKAKYTLYCPTKKNSCMTMNENEKMKKQNILYIVK